MFLHTKWHRYTQSHLFLHIKRPRDASHIHSLYIYFHYITGNEASPDSQGRLTVPDAGARLEPAGKKIPRVRVGVGEA